jgi:putative DNA primase/helicase
MKLKISCDGLEVAVNDFIKLMTVNKNAPAGRTEATGKTPNGHHKFITAAQKMGSQASTSDEARDALAAISPDIGRDEWVQVGMAAQSAGLGFDDFNEWSSRSEKYSARDARDTWRSFTPGKGIGPATLFKIARDNGWRGGHRPALQAPTFPPIEEPPRRLLDPAEIWARLAPATTEHPYIRRKQADGVPLDGLRVVPADDPLKVAGEPMAGALVVPLRRADGSLASLQFITPPDTTDRLKAKGKPGKLNLPGASLDGWFTVGDLLPDGLTYLCEGIGQAWACWQATGRAAVVSFGAGRMRAVAAGLRDRYPEARLVIVPDVGKEEEARKVAAEVRAETVLMPQGWPQNSDVSDLAARDGFDALEALLTQASEKLPLDVVFADQLSSTFEAPDELVQGVLTAGAGSMLYGDSNCGKTFLSIDMACAVARGVPWMGRRTEQGLVVYAAAESPASVKSRLQAYQTHHRCRVPNFAIVQSPLDLYSSEADTDALIALVRQVERLRGQKARLIVGDTLARLSAGANENSGEDMGMVVKRFDRIRAECAAHFLLIHHSGKAAANGARGWSGIRAAMDSEIEVVDGPTGRCAEITKQRDLSTKGTRIGFSLERVEIGLTKWGEPATTCVVVPTDAPAKETKAKRMGPVEGAVLEHLRAQPAGVKRAAVAQHFDGQYARTSVYRAITTLADAGMAHVAEQSGMVCIAEAAR